MNVIYEHDDAHPIPADAIDGMEQYLDELSKPNGYEWDILRDKPPVYSAPPIEKNGATAG